MARIVSVFQFSGRAGSAVGYKGKNGKIALRQYQPSMADPRTAAQMSQRAKMKLAAQVAAMLGEVGRTALVANGKKKTERGQLVKQLMKAIKVNSDGSKASLGYDLNLVNNPNYNRNFSVTLANEGTAYVATFTGAEAGEVIAKAILVHDTATGQWRRVSTMDTNTSLSLNKSANESGHAIEVFAYGIVLMPKTVEGFNNVGPTSANQAGYVIDLAKVSNTNYNFSPSISAALTVEGDGSTTGGNGSPSTGADTPGNTGGNGGSTAGNDTLAAPVIRGNTPFADSTEVSITAAEGAAIHYTTDGSTPTDTSNRYNAPFTLTATTTVKAVAINDGTVSTVATKTFYKSNGTDPSAE